MDCAHCGTRLPPGGRRDRRYCSKRCRTLASNARRRAGVPPPPRWQHPALGSDNPTLRAAAARAQQLGEAHGWSPATVRCTIDGLTGVLDGRPAGEHVPLTEVRTRTPRHASNPRVAEVLSDLGLLDDDTTLAVRSWIDRRTSELPAGFAETMRTWLLVPLDGDARTRPRSHSTIYVFFGAVRPFLQRWSSQRGHLREITAGDIDAVLDPLRGWPRRTAITALRSLFRFAKKRGLVFIDPTTRLKADDVERSLLPMTDAEIRAVEQVAGNPAQRLIIALAAVHAARPAAIRQLLLDDLDLPNRRITIAGHTQTARRADPPCPASLARPAPHRLAAHAQPARADLPGDRPRGRGHQQELSPVSSAAPRCRPRPHPQRPDPARGADRRTGPAAPGPGLQPVAHHRKPVRGHRAAPARRPARAAHRAVAID